MITAYLISHGTVTPFNILQSLGTPPVQPRHKPAFKRDTKGRFISPKSPVAIEKNPMAYFDYHGRSRIVRVISANQNDIIGLEKNPDTDKWQFKHFKMNDVQYMTMEFAPQSMPVFKRASW